MAKNMSRHKFFKILAYIFILPTVYLLNRMAKDHKKFSTTESEYRISKPPQGLSINGPIIISKEENQTKIFSSRCTHLGCMINKVEGNEIICPCHGSKYDKNGIPTKGPSIKALTKLDFYTDEKTKEIVVKLG